MSNYYIENYFKNIQHHSQDSYLQSLLYYKITGRKGAWIYTDEDSFLIVCQHPHEMHTMLVFCEVGSKTFDLTFSVLCQLYQSHHKIRLARYSIEDYEQLQKRLAKEPFNIIEALNIVEEDQMDWLYPVHIYDTGVVSSMDGSAYNRIRAKYKKVEKQEVTFRPLDKKTAIRDMSAALKYWEGSMIANNKDTDDMSAFYERFFELLGDYTEPYDGLLYFQGRKPLGFVVWDQVNNTQANSFINLADISVSGLSDFQTVTTCKTLKDKNVQYLNVGGSETENLDQFKQKFTPICSIPLISIEVVYKDFKTSYIKGSKFI